MEPLNDWDSVWYWVYLAVHASTPDSPAWRSVYYHLWRRFDYPFIHKDK